MRYYLGIWYYKGKTYDNQRDALMEAWRDFSLRRAYEAYLRLKTAALEAFKCRRT